MCLVSCSVLRMFFRFSNGLFDSTNGFLELLVSFLESVSRVHLFKAHGAYFVISQACSTGSFPLRTEASQQYVFNNLQSLMSFCLREPVTLLLHSFWSRALPIACTSCCHRAAAMPRDEHLQDAHTRDMMSTVLAEARPRCESQGGVA